MGSIPFYEPGITDSTGSDVQVMETILKAKDGKREVW